MSDVPNNADVRFCFDTGVHMLFKCGNCCSWHTHGSAGGAGDGWRSAHCHTQGQQPDYYLKKYTKKDLLLIKKWVNAALNPENGVVLK